MSDNITQDRWISVYDYLGVRRHTFMGWIEQRDMPASIVGKRWCFQAIGIDEWVRRGGASDEGCKSETISQKC